MIAGLVASLPRGVSQPVDAVTEEDSFPAQWRYVASESRWNATVCSRRSGKTAGCVRRAVRVLTTRPRARVLYLTLIRRNARKYFFEPLREYLTKKTIGFTVNEQTLSLRTESSGYVEVGSCYDMGDVEKYRGDQWDLVILDEAQSFRDDLIRTLVDQAILPSLGDRRGVLDILGTPPPGGKIGYLYEVFSSSRFAQYHWTLFDNPHFPAGEAEALCAARGLTPDHAIYRREFLGEFWVDPNSLVYEYQSPRNDYDSIPEIDSDQWRYSLGIDLGFSDRDAIVVLGWRRDDGQRRIYERESWQKNHLDVDELAEKFTEIYKRWRPQTIVGDTGGHGAVKVLKSLESRLGGISIAAKPASLLDSIGIVNDDLRTGRLLLSPRGPIADDARRVVWREGRRGVEISDSFHSDITEACRYALWGARHFKAKAPPPEPTRNERRDRALQRRRQALSQPWG